MKRISTRIPGKRTTGEPTRETDNWGTDYGSELPLAESLPGGVPDTKLLKFRWATRPAREKMFR